MNQIDNLKGDAKKVTSEMGIEEIMETFGENWTTFANAKRTIDRAFDEVQKQGQIVIDFANSQWSWEQHTGGRHQAHQWKW